MNKDLLMGAAVGLVVTFWVMVWKIQAYTLVPNYLFKHVVSK